MRKTGNGNERRGPVPRDQAIRQIASAEQMIAWSMVVLAACVVTVTVILLVMSAPAIKAWFDDLFR